MKKIFDKWIKIVFGLLMVLLVMFLTFWFAVMIIMMFR
jgi:hypothetical protein